MMTNSTEKKSNKKIKVECDGSYRVEGNIPLVHKTQIVSEYGEPLTWVKDDEYPVSETYYLCSCGHSADKPFCDQTHFTIDYDSTESDDVRPTAERQITYPGGTRITVKFDESLCMDSGFCCTRTQCIEDLVKQTQDPLTRSQVIAMVERCPSGALVYSIEENGPEIEPDYPEQIAVTTEITSEGPIEGPLWVTGGIPVIRCDGQMLERRNRVTLCRCGKSKNKPLCDGTHRADAESLRRH